MNEAEIGSGREFQSPYERLEKLQSDRETLQSVVDLMEGKE